MRSADELPEITKKKYKRILLLYQELDRHKVASKQINEFLCYWFSIVERTLNEIIRIYLLDDFIDIDVEHIELEYTIIDDFVKKLHKKAVNERKKLKLYEHE